MPLRKDTLYTIHNDLTHTVLDMSDAHSVRGWGWHGKRGQQWKLIKGDGENEWQLQNQRVNARYLSRVTGHDNHRLTGVTPAAAEATFVIEPVPEQPERYRIKHNNDAVTLATGGPGNTHNINANEQIPDLHADGPPIVLEAQVARAAQTATPQQKIETKNKQRAQIWSFRPVFELPLADGTYQIVNNRTGTVLGIANHADNMVQGQQSQANQANQKWVVTKDADGDSYTFKNSGAHDHFLGTHNNGAPAAGTALQARGDAEKKKFTIRKVPDSNYYKIFSVPNAHYVSPWAVNLGALDHGVYPVALQADEAEKWSFV